MPIELLPKRHAMWRKITVEEANEHAKETIVMWWRPNMTTYSKDMPEQDPVWVAEE